MARTAIIIGGGFAGLRRVFHGEEWLECYLTEKPSLPAGRAGKFSAYGFTFDMGPGRYWLPDVFERFFEQLGRKVT